MVAVPNPSTVAAGSKSLASTWNTDVRDADTYFLENLGGYGHRNGLVNSHFDIWQGGTSFAITSLATSKYCADQWYVRTNGTSNVAVTQVAGPTGQRYAMRVQRVAANANTTVIEVMQPLETPESYRFAGQTCQLKLNLKAGANFSATSSLVTVKVTYGTGTDQAAPASGWTGTTDALSTTQAITTTATDYTFDSISIPSSATQVQVYVSYTPVGTASTNDWVEIAGAQLTAGKMAAWERLAYAMQLQRCQRFYCQWGPYGTSTQFALTVAGGTTVAYCNIPLPVEMRIAPTVTFSANNDFKLYNINTTAVSASALGVKNLVAITATVASGLTTGTSYYLNNDQDPTNAAMYVNARL